MTLATMILVGGYVLLNQYLRRFYEARHMVAKLLRADPYTLATTLYPRWNIRLQHFQMFILAPVTGIMVWKAGGWIALGAYAVYAFVLAKMVAIVVPLPTHRHCVGVLQRSIDRSLAQDKEVLRQRMEEDYGVRLRINEDGQITLDD